ncbi:MAG TPA: DUF4340 domain-containing protein [Chitinophagales bacterium]|nr:DUF4340 domain-containing protein [Chitinophagales bacterium]
MKRNLIFLLILVALALGSYFFVIRKSWSTLNTDETAFAVDDTGAIGKIFIADMQGQKVTLERQRNFWIVNEKFPVRNDYIESLLSTLKRLSVDYPVPKAAMNKVVTEMAAHNKKVEVYDKNGKLMKAYYVGGPSLDSHGTYMKMENSNTPYVTSIPGFQGVLNTRYSTDEQGMRSLTIYNFKLNEIKEVSVNYAEKPDSSFTISVLGPDSFELKNSRGEFIDHSKLDKDKLHSYLNLFKFINCEAFVNDLSKKDTILQSQPFCTVKLVDRNNQQHPTVCYQMPLNPDSPMQYDVKGTPLKYDNDRYFATINNGQDFVIVQLFHFGRLLKSCNYFLQKTKQAS